MTRASALCSALVLALLVSRPAIAQAPSQHVLLTACNDTSAPIWVAVGASASQGWWKVEGGACRYVGSFLTYGVGFNVYAQASDGTHWSGGDYNDDWYCIDLNNPFNLSDGFREDSSADCPSGYTLKHFRFVHTPDGYGKDQDFSYTYRFHL